MRDGGLMALLGWRRHIDIRQGDRVIRIARRHAVYREDMRRDFDYWHGSVEPTIEHGLSIVDFSTPAVHRLRPSGDEFRFIGLPEHEDTTREFLDIARLQQGDLVLDLGAYCGATAVAFARAVGPTGHVVAFDPDPAAAEVCRQNIARHVPGRVSVVETGVWSHTGTVRFVAEGNVGSAVAAVLPRRARTREVPVLSLADAVARACQVSAHQRVAFIKLNVEGSEVPILEQASAVLRAHRPRLAVEPHPDDRGGLNTDRLQELLAAAGYRSSLRSQGSFTKNPLLAAEPV